MDAMYPQETVGSTLFKVERAGEYRRVFTREILGEFEVGEFTRGTLTYEIYGTQAHYHGVRLDYEGKLLVRSRLVELLGSVDENLEGLLVSYFEDGQYFLADFMDALDSWGIAYGYLDDVPGSYVTFRPRRMTRPTLSLIA